MTTKTRYFVIASLLVLGVGFGTGLVAYYVGFPAGAATRAGGPEELQYIPHDATVIAYANVQEVMASELRQKLLHALPMHESGQREFQDRTGINIETDIDRIVACLNPDPSNAKVPGQGMVLARGRFDEAKIELLMRDHGAQVEQYKGKRLVVMTHDPDAPSGDVAYHGQGFAAAFIEPGFVGLGSTPLIRSAIDLHQGGNNSQTGLSSATGNDELMNLVRSLDGGNAWAVGRFDALTSRAQLPDNVTSRLPAITWFAVSGHINGGLRGMIRAEARDEEAANNLRDVVRGFMGLAKMQSGSNPSAQLMMQSLELGGSGKTVALSFSVPAEVFDVVSGALSNGFPKKNPLK
jgi:hypothetical protein